MLITREVVERFYARAFAAMDSYTSPERWLDEYAPDEALLYEIASGEREVWVDAVNAAGERVAFRVTMLEALEAAALAYNEGGPTAYAVRAGMTLDEAEAANEQ